MQLGLCRADCQDESSCIPRDEGLLFFAESETLVAARINAGEGLSLIQPKSRPWSLPGPFYDFSITCTKTQQLTRRARRYIAEHRNAGRVNELLMPGFKIRKCCVQ